MYRWLDENASPHTSPRLPTPDSQGRIVPPPLPASQGWYADASHCAFPASHHLSAWFCLPVPANGHGMLCLALHCRLKRYTTSLRPFKLFASWFVGCMQQSLAPGWLRQNVCKLAKAANQPHCLLNKSVLFFRQAWCQGPSSGQVQT